MKSYPDTCIERAEKATEGPWKNVGDCLITEYDSNGPDGHRGASPEYYNCTGYEGGFPIPDNRAVADAEFIAHARTDVPELARRLNTAIRRLRELSVKRRDDEFTDELEAMKEEK